MGEKIDANQEESYIRLHVFTYTFISFEWYLILS